MTKRGCVRCPFLFSRCTPFCAVSDVHCLPKNGQELILFPAMQCTIYHLHVSMALPQHAEKLYRSLDIWRKLFHQALIRLSEQERGLLGVSKYAASLDLVTRKTIEAAARPSSIISPYLLRIPRSSTKELHHFLRNISV